MQIARTAAALALALLATAATACDPVGGGTTGDGRAPASTPATTASADLPSFAGMGLQAAQDKAQSLGFYRLDSHDALGRGRDQIWDRDWKICFQRPAPGSRPATGTVDFGAVKREESCPARDASPPASAGATMPDLTGTSVKVARTTLTTSTGVTAEDASGQDRFVLVESNWKVCSQSPAAGGRLTGQPVVFKAVKFGEACP
ncbi:PASTA domain-containing protein [Actinacidiphila glaucinigra]|uniref:PASTA domain-containing protein n=1 Tax=Actinacidiphila glaucinigra TaxID=235986 RepID=A0A239FTU5_9ACTN|nr:PASTA domain-containing protein [Actinacidiphila glaucinigra]SNS59968.1 PASTA domain-containing protein [Actinacidiphila glaucinigra]